MSERDAWHSFASDIVAKVYSNSDEPEEAVVKLLRDELGDFIDAIDWCYDCEERCTEDCDREPRYNEGYL